MNHQCHSGVGRNLFFVIPVPHARDFTPAPSPAQAGIQSPLSFPRRRESSSYFIFIKNDLKFKKLRVYLASFSHTYKIQHYY